MKNRDANLVMNFPIKKRINTSLFIDGMAALFILNVLKNMVRVVNHWYWLICGSCVLYAKDAEMRNQPAACFKMALTRM